LCDLHLLPMFVVIIRTCNKIICFCSDYHNIVKGLFVDCSDYHNTVKGLFLKAVGTRSEVDADIQVLMFL